MEGQPALSAADYARMQDAINLNHLFAALTNPQANPQFFSRGSSAAELSTLKGLNPDTGFNLLTRAAGKAGQDPMMTNHGQYTGQQSVLENLGMLMSPTAPAGAKPIPLGAGLWNELAHKSLAAFINPGTPI